MKDGFRQSMAWLHTWSGLLVGWVLFLVFSAGTASCYRQEISLWMRPELHAIVGHLPSQVEAAEQGVAALQQRGPDATRWFINLPDDRDPLITTFWNPPKPAPGRKRFESASFDPRTGEPVQGLRDTRGGEFIYRLHFDLHYMPALWARWIVGFCAMVMLVAIVSGVITHKRIFKDFFTFRPKKGQRSWLDAHNATAVLALPYHLMITYTGLVTLMFMFMPWASQAAYRGVREEGRRARRPRLADRRIPGLRAAQQLAAPAVPAEPGPGVRLHDQRGRRRGQLPDGFLFETVQIIGGHAEGRQGWHPERPVEQRPCVGLAAAVRTADKDKPWAAKLVKAFPSAEVKAFVQRNFAGSMVPAF